jgi:hypothetical protein
VETLSSRLTRADAAGSVPLVLDPRIAHERWGSSSKPLLNGQLRYPRPDDIDRPLNKAAADKIRDYRVHYTCHPPNSISFMPAVASTSGRLHCELVRIFFFLQAHRETDFPAKMRKNEKIGRTIFRLRPSTGVVDMPYIRTQSGFTLSM